MSINPRLMRLALRTRLLGMDPVATTGSISLAATTGASGGTFTRTTGSFLDDGFEPGQEITVTGFGESANNTGTNGHVVVSVAALTMQVRSVLATEAASTGRTLAAVLPTRRAWENSEFEPDAGAPYLEEQFIPGPNRQLTGTGNATLEVDPQYQIQLHIPADVGAWAGDRYLAAILSRFEPGTNMALSNGDTLRVRTNTGPFGGQAQRFRTGWITVPITIPLRLYTLTSV